MSEAIQQYIDSLNDNSGQTEVVSMSAGGGEGGGSREEPRYELYSPFPGEPATRGGLGSR